LAYAVLPRHVHFFTLASNQKAFTLLIKQSWQKVCYCKKCKFIQVLSIRLQSNVAIQIGLSHCITHVRALYNFTFHK